MTPFYVGMKVVCVDDDWHTFGNPSPQVGKPVKGGVYTISRINTIKAAPTGITLSFVGLTLPFSYCATAFRPVVENSMKELRSLLVPLPYDAKNKKQVLA